jgi:hypothetical protein
MVSDTIRGVSGAITSNTIEKYQHTYAKPIQYLKSSKFSVESFEEMLEENIKTMNDKTKKGYYLSCTPFFNKTNSIVYYIIHYTNHIKGFMLFKKSVWNTFDGHSSGKDMKCKQKQMLLDFNKDGTIHYVDKNCFNIDNMVDYLVSKVNSHASIKQKELWNYLDCHPVFISEGYRNKIKSLLKQRGCVFSKDEVFYMRGK